MQEEKEVVDMVGLDEEEEEPPRITIQTSDGSMHSVTVRAAELSVVLKTMMECPPGEEKVLHLENVSASTLDKLIVFLEKYVEMPMETIEKPLRSSKMLEVVKPLWYANYIQVPDAVLFDLLNAANYLNVDPLLQLSSAKLASWIKNKTPKEIRARFGIPEPSVGASSAPVALPVDTSGSM
jgi:S-phase kinase-associated protein 1